MSKTYTLTVRWNCRATAVAHDVEFASDAEAEAHAKALVDRIMGGETDWPDGSPLHDAGINSDVSDMNGGHTVMLDGPEGFSFEMDAPEPWERDPVRDAAPAMLEALEKIIADNYGHPRGVTVPWLDPIRAIVAAARGEG